MLTKRLYITVSVLMLAGFAHAANNDSLILLNTNKTVEATKPKQKAKIEPSYNITNVLDSSASETTDIYFSADELQSESKTNLVTASGNVEIIREDLTLRADKVSYDKNNDHISAQGNVILVEKNGNVVFADKINLKEHMQDADVENIKVVLLDKTRMAAQSFHKKADNRKVLRKAVYTPCNVCRTEAPLWQIKAGKVIHNPEDKNIEYQNAFLEIKDVPVLYTPYFSHPDPSVKHRSGFLFPRFMSNNYLGASIQPQYFWDISPQENMIFNPILSTEKGIVYSGIFNKYFYRGELNASGTFLQDRDDDNKNRGNLFLYGRYELNDYWVADTDINYASDHNYLKDMSLPKKDDSWLTSRLRFQAFDYRNYASVESYYYNMLSYNLQKSNRPYVLPIMGYENYSAPDRYGAYTKTVLNAASVYHKEDDSTQRLTMINSWNLPYTSPYGEKYKLSASLKSDLYYIDRYLNPENEVYSGTTARIIPQIGLEWRLPFIKNTTNTSQILEPIIVAAVAPNQDNQPDKIPNEDSQDIELTDVNIFDLDRYSGYDRNDTGSRVSYGLNWSAYDKKWGRTAFLLAQTYEFNQEDNLLNQANETSHLSDYIGRVYAAPSNYFNMNYRFKIDKDDFKVNYSELSASAGSDVLRLYTSYIFFPEADNTSLLDSSRRQEIYLSLQSKITRNWSAQIFTREDLVNKKAISHGGGITYEDECAKFSFSAEKEYSEDPSADNDITFYFSFFLKTLGGVGTN